MSQGQVAARIEHEVAPHLRHIQLLGMPAPSSQRKKDVAPDHPRGHDGEKTFPSQAEPLVRPSLGVGKPKVWRMPQMLGKSPYEIRTGERDDGDLATVLGDLLVELPQLREMLLAVKSTEVAQQNQDGRPAEQPARVERLPIGRA